MSYGAESKRVAKAYLAEVRSRTRCRKCGRQPVDFHRQEHEVDGNQRVSRMAARGCAVERIAAEIVLCEALCRSCHMRADGRLAELHRRRPHQKGYRAPAVICSECGCETKPAWKGKCRRCYDAARRGTRSVCLTALRAPPEPARYPPAGLDA